MRKIIFFALLFLFVANLSQARPKLKFSSGYTYDFGEVKQKDSPLKADITLFNKGTDTLVIKRVKPMCGCTTAPLSKKTIPPGDSAILKVTLNVEHYEGVVEKRISFSTNYRTEEVFLTLKANVYKPISIFPGKYFNFAQMYVGEETSSKLVLNNLSQKDIKVTKVIVQPADQITINIQEGTVLPTDSAFVIEATVNPKQPGPFSARFDIFIDDPDMPSFRLSGFGRIDPIASKPKDFKPKLKVNKNDTNIKLIEPPEKKPIVNPNESQQPINEPIQQDPKLLLPKNQVNVPKPKGNIKVIDPKKTKKLENKKEEENK